MEICIYTCIQQKRTCINLLPSTVLHYVHRKDDNHYHRKVIIGTGTNACYLEQTDAIIKSQGFTTSGSMVVNMEWGNFWSSHLPRTSYDIDLDADTLNPNDQGFEKMISELYLGEIVRRVILKVSRESDIFAPVSSRIHLMAAMQKDNSPDLLEVEQFLTDFLELD